MGLIQDNKRVKFCGKIIGAVRIQSHRKSIKLIGLGESRGEKMHLNLEGGNLDWCDKLFIVIVGFGVGEWLMKLTQEENLRSISMQEVLDEWRGYANKKPNIIPRGQYDKGLSFEVASGRRKLIFAGKINRSS